MRILLAIIRIDTKYICGIELSPQLPFKLATTIRLASRRERGEGEGGTLGENSDLQFPR